MKSQNIYYTAYPLLVFLKILGIFVPSFDKNGNFRITVYDKLYFIFIKILLTTILVCSFLKPQNGMSSSLLLSAAWEFCGYFGNLMTLLMMFYQYRHSMDFVRILNTINEFDEQVS